ncbi:DUF3099 domain-containing protein [Nocardioides fonticola]|uniref:DUF3099 domain-containing protein n=1 Tax=Nocardioides fonticola TaxID=450363 RepID=UPI0031D808E1
MAKQRPQDDVVRITTVGTSRAQDIATRQRRYLLSMSLRSLCFVGAVIAGLAGIGWLWPILIAGALILPYFAVVLANVSTMRNDTFELRRTIDHPELGPRR